MDFSLYKDIPAVFLQNMNFSQENPPETPYEPENTIKSAQKPNNKNNFTKPNDDSFMLLLLLLLFYGNDNGLP